MNFGTQNVVDKAGYFTKYYQFFKLKEACLMQSSRITAMPNPPTAQRLYDSKKKSLINELKESKLHEICGRIDINDEEFQKVLDKEKGISKHQKMKYKKSRRTPLMLLAQNPDCKKKHLEMYIKSGLKSHLYHIPESKDNMPCLHTLCQMNNKECIDYVLSVDKNLANMKLKTQYFPVDILCPFHTNFFENSINYETISIFLKYLKPKELRWRKKYRFISRIDNNDQILQYLLENFGEELLKETSLYNLDINSQWHILEKYFNRDTLRTKLMQRQYGELFGIICECNSSIFCKIVDVIGKSEFPLILSHNNQTLIHRLLEHGTSQDNLNVLSKYFELFPNSNQEDKFFKPYGDTQYTILQMAAKNVSTKKFKYFDLVLQNTKKGCYRIKSKGKLQLTPISLICRNCGSYGNIIVNTLEAIKRIVSVEDKALLDLSKEDIEVLYKNDCHGVIQYILEQLKEIEAPLFDELQFSPRLENGKCDFKGSGKDDYQVCMSKNAINLEDGQTYKFQFKIIEAKHKRGIFIGLCSGDYNRQVYLGTKKSFSLRTVSDYGKKKCDIRNNGGKDIITNGKIVEGDKIALILKDKKIQYLVNGKKFGGEQKIPHTFKFLNLCIGLFGNDSVGIYTQFRRNEFRFYPKKFQNLIIFLLLAQDLRGKEDKVPFSRIPKDCLFEIFSFMDIYE